jgi:molybdate transport system substrate-binding protein
LAILSWAGIDALLKQGKVLPGSDVTLAGSGVAIAVKAGAPKPDISTPEALKQTLLKAKSIAYSEPSAGGASGVYFAKLLERMGIAEQMKPKTKFPPAGGFSAELLLIPARLSLRFSRSPNCCMCLASKSSAFCLAI